jgi:hypothetical protein
MTIEQLQRIATLAGAVAIEAPWTRNKYAVEARVPWELIVKLRAELTLAGVDWQTYKIKSDKDLEARRETLSKERYKLKRAIGKRGVA